MDQLVLDRSYSVISSKSYQAKKDKLLKIQYIIAENSALTDSELQEIVQSMVGANKPNRVPKFVTNLFAESIGLLRSQFSPSPSPGEKLVPDPEERPSDQEFLSRLGASFDAYPSQKRLIQDLNQTVEEYLLDSIIKKTSHLYDCISNVQNEHYQSLKQSTRTRLQADKTKARNDFLSEVHDLYLIPSEKYVFCCMIYPI